MLCSVQGYILCMVYKSSVAFIECMKVYAVIGLVTIRAWLVIEKKGKTYADVLIDILRF